MYFHEISIQGSDRPGSVLVVAVSKRKREKTYLLQLNDAPTLDILRHQRVFGDKWGLVSRVQARGIRDEKS